MNLYKTESRIDTSFSSKTALWSCTSSRAPKSGGAGTTTPTSPRRRRAVITPNEFKTDLNTRKRQQSLIAKMLQTAYNSDGVKPCILEAEMRLSGDMDA